MEKVLLITTRQIAKIKDESYFGAKPIDACDKCYPYNSMFHDLLKSLWMNNETAQIELNNFYQSDEGAKFNNGKPLKNTIGGKEHFLTWEASSTAIKAVVKETDNPFWRHTAEMVSKYIKNSGGSKFVYGLFYKKIKDYHVYIANENPLGENDKDNFNEGKKQYLEALINCIKEHQKATAKKDSEQTSTCNFEWSLILHDYDYKEKVSTNDITEEIKNATIESKYANLSTVLNASATKVYVFQHTITDSLYTLVRYYLESIGEYEDFETCMRAIKDNIAKFKALTVKDKIESEDYDAIDLSLPII